MSTPPVAPAQLSELGATIRRHWAIVVVAGLIGSALGALAWLAIPTHYTATSTVSVSPMNADPLSTSSADARSVSMPTEQQLVRSRMVAEAAAASLGSTTTTSMVQDATSVESPRDSLILSIQYEASSAEKAATGADAVASAYLKLRADTASAEVKRLTKSATNRLNALQIEAADEANAGEAAQRSLLSQIDALSDSLAILSSTDITAGEIVGQADIPRSPSTPGALPLVAAGLTLGLLVGIPIALSRKPQESSEIGGVEGLSTFGDHLVLDGTKDADPRETWDIAAFMLKLPSEPQTEPYLVMVDGVTGPGRSASAGQDLVDALSRRGRAARYVDAGAINEGKISRGWPTSKKIESWGSEVVVIDSSTIASEANKVALATRSDAVVLSRSTEDDAAAMRRFAGLLKSEDVNVALTTLFPPRPEIISLMR